MWTSADFKWLLERPTRARLGLCWPRAGPDEVRGNAERERSRPAPGRGMRLEHQRGPAGWGVIAFCVLQDESVQGNLRRVMHLLHAAESPGPTWKRLET